MRVNVKSMKFTGLSRCLRLDIKYRYANQDMSIDGYLIVREDAKWLINPSRKSMFISEDIGTYLHWYKDCIMVHRSGENDSSYIQIDTRLMYPYILECLSGEEDYEIVISPEQIEAWKDQLRPRVRIDWYGKSREVAFRLLQLNNDISRDFLNYLRNLRNMARYHSVFGDMTILQISLDAYEWEVAPSFMWNISQGSTCFIYGGLIFHKDHSGKTLGSYSIHT